MKLPGTSSNVLDLTRWNRSGLQRVRYIDGAAAEWVEHLRVAHLLLYARTDQLGVSLPDEPEVWVEGFKKGILPDGATTLDRAKELASAWQRLGFDGSYPDTATYPEILRAQYDFIGLDHTHQISRAFARAFHILTESLNAYANEGYLKTATQNTHLRRLLEMIGYKTVPASSALVPIALKVSPDTGDQTQVAGIACEYNPGNGEPMITYESLDTLATHPDCNIIRGKNWDQRSDPIAANQTSFEVLGEAIFTHSLNSSLCLAKMGTEIEGMSIISAEKTSLSLNVKRGAVPFDATYQGVEIFVAPTINAQARPRTNNWIHFATKPKCSVGQIIALDSGTSWAYTDWYAESLIAKSAHGDDPFDLTIDAVVGPFFENSGKKPGSDLLTNSNIYAYTKEGYRVATIQEIRGADIRVNVSVPSDLNRVFSTIQSVEIDNPANKAADDPDTLILGAYYVPEGSDQLGTIEKLEADYVFVEGALPDVLKEETEITLVLSDGTIYADTVQDLITSDDGYSILLSKYADKFKDVASLHCGFQSSTALAHEIRSSAALFSAEGRIYLAENAAQRSLLRAGRRIIVTTDPELADPAPLAFSGTVASHSKDTDASFWITLEEDTSPISTLTRGNAVIYGNVALFGQGKTQVTTVLGNGDSAQLMQVMELPDGPLSTRPDPMFPGGVVQDITIAVDGRTWRQVADEDDATDETPSYSIQIDDLGTAQVTFHQRLTTGEENVILTKLRVGASVDGNDMEPFEITAPKPKIAGIDALVQPIAPQYGADLQDADDLRDQGQSHFALSDRALSVSDFATLAQSHSGVWHAYAQLQSTVGIAGFKTIYLTIVPSNGGTATSVVSELTDYLLARSLPNTILNVQDFEPATFGGTLKLTLKTGYARSQSIIDEVKAILDEGFNLQNRPLGETLFLTEIIAAVEHHDAVENLTFEFSPNWATATPKLTLSNTGAIQAAVPENTQTVYLASADDIEVSFSNGGGA